MVQVIKKQINPDFMYWPSLFKWKQSGCCCVNWLILWTRRNITNTMCRACVSWLILPMADVELVGILPTPGVEPVLVC